MTTAAPSTYATKRDARARANAPEGYVEATVAMTRSYDEAIGWALQYGIKTYRPGTGRPGDFGPWGKALGDLRDEILAHEKANDLYGMRHRPNPARTDRFGRHLDQLGGRPLPHARMSW